MELREWTKEDIKNIAALERVCFSDPWTDKMLEKGFASPIFYGILLEEQGEILGYACETVLFEDAEIAIVAVAPNYRKQGLGKVLVERLENIAISRGAENLFLEVRVSNSAALALYQGFGFEIIRTRKRYYADGEDAFVMKKFLL